VIKNKPKTNYKTVFSLLTIAVVILILLLLPKRNESSKNKNYVPPRVSSRRIPAPTPTPNANGELISVNSQAPGNRLVVNLISSEVPVYIYVYKNSDLIGESELITDLQENLQIDLINKTSDNDVLMVQVLNEEDEVLFEKEVLITTTALAPGVILPRDLQ
jgi:hypothetical protein